MTARASDAKQGLLDLEGDLTPIMVSLVRKDKAVNDLLDDAHAAESEVARRAVDAADCVVACSVRSTEGADGDG